MRAIKQRVFKKARKDTWNKFVNSLNSRTPTKKVCEKFRKVNGNYKPRIVSPLDRGKNRNKKREEELPYNKLFTDRELQAAINHQKNTAPGEKTVHPQMIKKNYHQRP